MKCPYCDYENNTCWPFHDESDHGPFYKLEITLKRSYVDADGYTTNESKELIGCPKCTTTFID